MKVKTMEIGGFLPSISAMRLPFDSCDKSDTICETDGVDQFIDCQESDSDRIIFSGDYCYKVGDKDLSVMQKLILNGDEHAKFIRGVHVWARISAPRYFWQEMDTYRIGTETLSSQSTMHTILKKDLTLDDFDEIMPMEFLEKIIKKINTIRQSEILSKDEKLIQIKTILPESFIQTRIRTFSYQSLRTIFFQRKNHKLPQWVEFIDWIVSLPLAKYLITVEKKIA